MQCLGELVGSSFSTRVFPFFWLVSRYASLHTLCNDTTFLGGAVCPFGTVVVAYFAATKMDARHVCRHPMSQLGPPVGRTQVTTAVCA